MRRAALRASPSPTARNGWCRYAGVAAIAADGSPAERIDFVRDSQGRIARVTGVPQGESGATSIEATSIIYRYDPQARLVLVRDFGDSGDFGTAYGYDADGHLLSDTLTAGPWHAGELGWRA